MSSGQSLRNGSSVEPGLPNPVLMPKDRSRSRVACLTVTDLLALLPFLDTVAVPLLFIDATSPALVIASEAKQSRVSPRRQPGLLRRFAPRNDEERISPHRGALHGRL